MSLVHKCSFLGWRPSEILHIVKSDELQLLAVARGDSTIELWTTKTNKSLPNKLSVFGGKNYQSPIVGMAIFKNNNRSILLSVTQDKIYQWDISTLSLVQELNSMNPSIVGMSFNDKLKVLVTCSLDSSIQIYNFTLNLFEFHQSFPRIHQSIPSCIEISSFDNDTIVCGTNNEVLVLSLKSKSTLLTITSPSITAIKILGNSTFAFGNDVGALFIAEYKFGSILQNFKDLIGAIRTIELLPSQDTLYISGDDPTLVSYTLKKSNIALNISENRWGKSGLHRKQTHDVKSLCFSSSNNRGIIYSGGVSTQLTMFDNEMFSEHKIQQTNTINNYPLNNIATTSGDNASNSILLIESFKTSINIWLLGNIDTDNTNLDVPNGVYVDLLNKTKHLLQLESKHQEFIESVDISKNGKYFSYSTRSNVQLYSLDINNGDNIKINRIALPFEEHKIPISFIRFTKDSKQLILSSHSTIYSFNIEDLNNIEIQVDTDSSSNGQLSPDLHGNPRDLEMNDINITADNHHNSRYKVLDIQISDDSTLAATLDSANRINIFNLLDSKFKYSIPNFNERILKIKFKTNTNTTPNSKKGKQNSTKPMVDLSYCLYILTENNFIIYDLNEIRILNSIPKPSSDHPIISITSHPSNSNQIMLWSENSIFKYGPTQNQFTKISHFKDVIFASVASDNHLVVVQLSYLDKILPELPPAIKYIKKFGQ